MDAALLDTLLGGSRTWSAPCVVILTTEATVRSPGPDTILGGGIKNYAPRYSSGRVEADTCCLLPEQSALLIVQQQTYKDGTGQTLTRRSLLIADLKHIVGVEFPHFDALKALGVAPPPLPDEHEYRPGTLVG